MTAATGDGMLFCFRVLEALSCPHWCSRAREAGSSALTRFGRLWRNTTLTGGEFARTCWLSYLLARSSRFIESIHLRSVDSCVALLP